MGFQIDFDVTKTYDPSATPSNWPASPPLGTEVKDQKGRTWRFVQAGGTITAKNFLTRDLAEGEHHYHHTSAAAQPIEAIANIACTDNFRFWVVVKGRVNGCNVGTPSQGDILGSTSTAGRADALAVSASPTQAEVQAINAAKKLVRALSNAAANAADCYIE